MDSGAVEIEKLKREELDRDLFLRELLSQLTGTLQDVIGEEETVGFVSLVGQKLGDWVNRIYCEKNQPRRMTVEQVIEALLDFKRTIGSDFRVVEESEDGVVFENSQCPFGCRVKGRQSLCMMTSNVFGSVTSNNLGYAHVELEETIASGDEKCRVAVSFQPPDSGGYSGREYFRPIL